MKALSETAHRHARNLAVVVVVVVEMVVVVVAAVELNAVNCAG